MTKQSGVYKIINRATQDFYVGESVNIEERFNGHFYMAIHNAHRTYFQRALLYYGKCNFYFQIIEECSKLEARLAKESYYIVCLAA